MESRDYLQKQIDLLGQVLGKILADLLKIKTDVGIGSNLNVVNEILKSGTKIDLEDVRNTSKEEWIAFLTEEHHFHEAHLQEFAIILTTIANELEDNKLKTNLFEKALIIHQYLNYLDTTFVLERENAMIELKKKLNL